MIRGILKHLLPTRLYVGVWLVDINGYHLGWQESKYVAEYYVDFAPTIFARIAAWTIFSTGLYFGTYFVIAYLEGRI